MYKNALNQALKLYPYLFDFISIRREKEGGFIFNPHIYSERWINNSSVEILELINGRNTVEDIINIITSKKQISYQQASNFVQSQLQILQSYFALKYLSNSLKEGEEQNPYHIPDNYVDYNANYYSAPLTVLWDITYRCNMKCVHCLIDNEIPRNELTLDQVKQVLDELRKLRVFSINFSGGEPFLRKDLLDILKHASSLNFNLKISTNGYYLTKDLLDKLGNLDVYCFQISLDGLGNTHDSFRNFKGGFKKAVEAFELVSQEGHFAVMSTMLTKYNYHEIFELLELAVSLGVSIFKLNSFMPTGRGKINQESLLLDKKDVMKLAKDMVEYSKKYQNKIDIQYDALFPWLLKKEEKQTDNQNQYHSCDIRCSAGHTTLVITSDGTVISCPYLTDYPLGNVLTTSISDIWHNNSSILGKFRKLKQIDLKGKCKSCLFVPESCPGGCRAAAKIRTGDFLQEDPFCWK